MEGSPCMCVGSRPGLRGGDLACGSLFLWGQTGLGTGVLGVGVPHALPGVAGTTDVGVGVPGSVLFQERAVLQF